LKEGKSGGLNEYGIAKYKLTDNFAQKEVDFLLQIGGIEIRMARRWAAMCTERPARGTTRCSSAWAWAPASKLGLTGEEARVCWPPSTTSPRCASG
jgi:glutamate synthase (NADPH/NADH) small chain